MLREQFILFNYNVMHWVAVNALNIADNALVRVTFRMSYLVYYYCSCLMAFLPGEPGSACLFQKRTSED